MPTAKRRFRWGFVVLGVIALALFAWVIFGKKPAKPPAPPPISVSTAVVGSQDVPVSITALGAAQSWSSVTVHAQVSGKLFSTPFTEGGDVRAGQLLAQIDPAPYQAALMQAQGVLKHDQALLQDARLDLARYQKLAAQDSISGQQVDTQAALVKQDEGTVLADQGAVKAAEVNLAYCRITSPTNGRAGVRLVDAGNLVSASDTTGIVVVNQISPIAVTFTVPQGDFQRLSQASDAFQRPMTTQAISQDNSELLDTGELTIADNHVDASTATVALKARFPNAKQTLWPGQFVNVKLTLQTLPHAITVPLGAVNQGPNGAFVYVVGANDQVSARPVTVLLEQDMIAVIKSGLKPGETVVTDGQMMLKPGAKIAAHAAQTKKSAA